MMKFAEYYNEYCSSLFMTKDFKAKKLKMLKFLNEFGECREAYFLTNEHSVMINSGELV